MAPKSRKRWLIEGDRNTSYFHLTTKQRKQKQRIRALTTEDEVIHFRSSRVGKIAIDYFQHQYTSTPIQKSDLQEAFSGFNSRVTAETNDLLIKPVTTEEIRTAVFSIGPTRAPGPDGFTGAFYQNHWEDINKEFIEEIKKFSNDDIFDTQNNHTNLCIIPKIGTPTSMGDYRPIALCNVSYKVIFKIIINRMNSHLSHIISPNQAAFIPEQIISDT